MIYATVGTMHLDFARLIHALDAYAATTDESVVIQTGLSKIVPRYADYFPFRPRAELLTMQADARVIVCHAGIGSVIDALQAARPLIVVPRLQRFGEHNNDHQIDLARAVEHRGWGKAVYDMDDLAAALADPPPACTNYAPDKLRLVNSVRSFIENAAKAQ